MTPVFAPAALLATVEDLAAYLNPHGRGLDETALHERLLAAASARVAERTGRLFLPDPAYLAEDPVDDTAPDTIKTVRCDPGSVRVRVPDIREATEITTDGVALDPAGYTLVARRAGEPAVWLDLTSPTSGPVEVTGRFGFAAVPADIREATVVLAARALYERNARLADVTQDPEGGVASYFRQIPPTVAATLDAYRPQALRLRP